jgi:membrane associated rhomboid family serine protease
MTFRLTRAVKVLLVSCLATFLVQQTIDRFFGGNLLGWLGLVPSSFVFGFRFWQLFTYAFLHADVMHLFLNGLMLAFIGGEIEALWGTRRFLVFYFSCTSAAAVLYLILHGIVAGGAGDRSPLVGASGGIYGLLVAYGILFAERQLLFMMAFPMKAKHFVLLLVALELMTTVFSPVPGSALSGLAHLGGLAGGFIFLAVQARIRKARRASGSRSGGGNTDPSRRSRKTSHLKLIKTSDSEKKTGSSSLPSLKPQDAIPQDSDEDGDDLRGPKTWH